MPVPAPPLNDHEREAAARRQKLIRSWVVSLEDYSKTNKGIINPDGLVKRVSAHRTDISAVLTMSLIVRRLPSMTARPITMSYPTVCTSSTPKTSRAD